MSGRPWTDKEITFLKENYLKMNCRQLSLALNRNYSSTKKKLSAHVYKHNQENLPLGFKTITVSPIHAVNSEGVIINIRTRKVLKGCLSNKGYVLVCLQNKKTHSVHRIVAQIFVPNPTNLPQVNHKDGNKQNNNFLNLEWCTNNYNRHHAIELGLWNNIGSKVSVSQRGEGNSSAKLTEADVLNIYTLLLNKMSHVEIAALYEVNRSTISAIKAGTSWSHLYHFYLECSTTSA